MSDNIRRKIDESRTGLEKLIGSIPGYKGYKERELRREADHLLRTTLADRLDEQRRRLLGVMGTLTSAVRLGEIMPFERATLRLQQLIDRLRTAAYGASGMFDAVKIKQKELDALYAFDSGLQTGVDRVAQLVGSLEAQANKGENTGPDANALLGVLQELNDTFGRRMDVIIGQE